MVRVQRDHAPLVEELPTELVLRDDASDELGGFLDDHGVLGIEHEAQALSPRHLRDVPVAEIQPE
jgi:hypothetical protein